MTVTGLVLAAGSSRRLGQPKQTLDYRGSTLLDATLTMAKSCGFGQLIVTLGGASDDVRTKVDLSGLTVVENPDSSSGCSSSIAAALAAVDTRAQGIVLLLGDQPGILTQTVEALIANSWDSPLGVCRYRAGRGHPFWFHHELFAELSQLHGDKAVWKLLESGAYPVRETKVDAEVPLDVDTWEDYEALLAQDEQREAVIEANK
ncbi:MAG: NTP transferase domain-containing protein [Acidimicrobiales bacterium]